jgi:hypothetical protein
MPKQMNEYVLLLNTGDAEPLKDTAFQSELSSWLTAHEVAADVVRSGPGSAAHSFNLVCTAEVARDVIGAFGAQIAASQMARENVITIPDPLPKKTRSPGY